MYSFFFFLTRCIWICVSRNTYQSLCAMHFQLQRTCPSRPLPYSHLRHQASFLPLPPSAHPKRVVHKGAIRHLLESKAIGRKFSTSVLWFRCCWARSFLISSFIFYIFCWYSLPHKFGVFRSAFRETLGQIIVPFGWLRKHVCMLWIITPRCRKKTLNFISWSCQEKQNILLYFCFFRYASNYILFSQKLSYEHRFFFFFFN